MPGRPTTRRASLALALALAAMAVARPAAASFESCVAGLKRDAVRAGVSPSVASKALDGARYDEKAVRFSGKQPEHKTPIWDYMAFLVDEQRISDGKAMMRKYDRVLRAVQQRYGVDRHVVAAVWGIESNYGRDQGDFYIPHALASLTCVGGRRSSFFREQLIAALKLASQDHLRTDQLYGSWAGAFGQTQFIPTTYRRLAVDGDGDGRRDLINSVPDALASTANFLRKSGWRPGESFLWEVKLPNGYRGPSGRKRTASIATWRKRGLTKVDGRPLGNGGNAGLLLPAGKRGPAFLVFRNFNAIYSYNLAESYALAISHLADRLAGYGPIQTPWPTRDGGLSRAERLELQKLLNRAGFNVGEPDGKVGQATRAGIERAEAHFGMEVTGRAGREIYRRLGGR
ncbi:lytic murein transglycosylase [Rhodobium gokarnense]|uniref:Lytic murein transglycosylase n=1 Tax=Rhodobium gokarnense TaxID=364296 RepID=A0ABT3H815_9HYPH|nr:lytic murein transglycosylase [Rhodobium gokarnense]MCW2306534.1 lytic murein transglycosylase [Rhodobium gokarnense]